VRILLRQATLKCRQRAPSRLPKDRETLFVLRFNVLAASGKTAISFRDPATDHNTFFFNEDIAPAKLSDSTLTVNSANSAAFIRGRVVGADNRPVFKAQVTLIDNDGNVRYAVTNQNGYYHFTNVLSEQNYVICVTHKQHRFDSQTVGGSANLNEVNSPLWNRQVKIILEVLFFSKQVK
jgi:hypothetical protein